MPNYYMRTETAAVSPDAPLRFKRADCEGCKKETVHRGLKCIECGTLMKLMTPRGQVARYGKRRGIKDHSARVMDVNLRIREAKQAAFHAAAEASRKKFEGK